LSWLLGQHHVQVKLRGLLTVAFLFSLLGFCDQFFGLREEGLRIVVPVVGRLLSFLLSGVSEVAALVTGASSVLP
jgi:type III secretory pathway component EscU